MHKTSTSTRRRVAVLAAATIGVAAIGANLLSSQAADASGRPDLKISQRISGSTKSGHTIDTITVRNHGSATASAVSIQLYANTNGPFGDTFTGGAGTCEVIPAPKGYDYGTACQFSASIGAGKSASFIGDFSGTVGAKFTNLATVGDLQGDPNYKDNQSTVTSWFGRRADLRVVGTAKPGTKKGHVTAVTTVVNRGPNNASHIQEVIEVKHMASVVASGTGTCQIVPPAAGYNLAFSCVRSGLNTGQAWKLTFDYRGGTSGQTATMKTMVSSFVKDPNSKNNTMTKTATVK